MKFNYIYSYKADDKVFHFYEKNGQIYYLKENIKKNISNGEKRCVKKMNIRI